jgi:hypothetical protein
VGLHHPLDKSSFRAVEHTCPPFAFMYDSLRRFRLQENIS